MVITAADHGGLWAKLPRSCSHPLNGEITSLGLKVERKNTNQCLSALIMEN